MVKNLPTNAGAVGLISWLGRSPGGENGNPPQYSCLGNPIDRGFLVGCKRVGHDLATNQQQLLLEY